MRKALLAAALALSAPGPCPAADRITPEDRTGPVNRAGPRDVFECKAEMEREMAESQALLAKLQRLKFLYDDPVELERVAPERDAIRKDLLARVDLLDQLHSEYKNFKREFQLIRGSQIITQIIKGKQEQPSDQDVASVIEIEGFSKSAGRFKDEARERVRQDEADYQAARTRVVDRRRNAVLAACGAAGGVMAVIGLAVLLRRRRRRQAHISVRTAPRSELPKAATPAPSLAAAPALPALGGPRTPVPVLLGGNYRISTELGKGAMGPVYEALDLSMQRKVVVKQVREEVHRTEGDLQRFLAEARAVSALKHPNLVEIHAILFENEKLFLVTEHVQGHPLSRYLDAGNRVVLSSTRRAMEQAGSALEYAHGHGVIHGDVKPSNIMIGADGTVKVKDFAISLLTRKLVAKLSWTDAGGDRAYMAPEQELGEARKESDIYSLGVVFYEMVTGRLPFEGPDFLAQKREMRFRPASQAVVALPARVDEVLRKAMAADPRQRYSTAAEFVAAVRGLPEDTKPGHKRLGGPG